MSRTALRVIEGVTVIGGEETLKKITMMSKQGRFLGSRKKLPKRTRAWLVRELAKSVGTETFTAKDLAVRVGPTR